MRLKRVKGTQYRKAKVAVKAWEFPIPLYRGGQ